MLFAPVFSDLGDSSELLQRCVAGFDGWHPLRDESLRQHVEVSGDVFFELLIEPLTMNGPPKP